MYDFFYNFYKTQLGNGLLFQHDGKVNYFNPNLPLVLHTIAWYDASDPAGTGILPSDGSPITSWFDKSLNSHAATNSDTATAPEIQLNFQNGLPGLFFDGASMFLTCTNTNNSTFDLQSGFTFMGVIQTSQLPIQRVFSRTTDTLSNGFAGGTGDSANFRFTTYTVRDYQTDSGFVSGFCQVLVITFDPSASNAVSFYVNGTLAVTLTDPSGPIPATTPMFIGSDQGTAEFWNGYLCELSFFNYVLNNTQINAINQYATTKWGI